MSASPPALFSPARQPHRLRSRAFTLVEVVLAIGIVAVAFVALLGLLPTGLGLFRDAMNATVSSQIAQRVLTDAQQTDFDTLIDHIPREDPTGEFNDLTFQAPTRNQPALRYFDDQGTEVIPANPNTLTPAEKRRIIYYVNTRITVHATRPKATVRGANNTGPDAFDFAMVTVEVAANPGNKTIPIRINPPSAKDETDALRNLFKPTPGITITTYSTMVARNQPFVPTTSS